MTRGRVTSAVVLGVFWVALWRTVTPGVLLSGVVVAAAAIWLVPGPRREGRVRVGAAARLAAHVVGQLVVATAHVAWEVLTPTDRSSPGVVTVHLPEARPPELTLIALLITLTPGSFVVDVDLDGHAVEVHLLHLSSEENARREVADLHRRIRAMWGDPDRSRQPSHPTPEARR